MLRVCRDWLSLQKGERMSSPPTPNLLNRLLIGLLWLIALVGPPAFLGPHLTPSWQTVAAFALYELFIVLIGFITLVGQQLLSNWAKRFADRIDNRLLARMPGYQKRY